MHLERETRPAAPSRSVLKLVPEVDVPLSNAGREQEEQRRRGGEEERRRGGPWLCGAAAEESRTTARERRDPREHSRPDPRIGPGGRTDVCRHRAVAAAGALEHHGHRRSGVLSIP
ncbi:hypothetical protein EYF80_062075 [Liparis tanakae]|uniref:Uncharacterized protein n=1 Tax=Liparis tanakae TaxID=230148 RepID=A0A4Z2EG97_9TELE|nr:hypothetical protein EYF80_062075 [Liparis tanakae]